MAQKRAQDFTKHWVSASEIGSHLYCARAAWLAKTQKEEPSLESRGKMAKGEREHKRHEKNWHRQDQASKWAWRLLILSLLILAVGFWLTSRS